MDVQTAISCIRRNLGISQEALAKRLGVSFTTVSRWENGKAVPRSGAFKRLEQMLLVINRESGGMRQRIAIERPSPRAPTVYAFFAGAGGFHLGIKQAGFKVLVATDIDPMAEKTHARNWPHIPFVCDDIRKLTADRLVKAAGGRKPDLIIGGPPCQGFSTLGDKLSSDPRNQLFDAYARLVEELSPKCLLIENVKAFLSMYRGQYAEYVGRKLSYLGYTMYRAVLNAADYGVPQIRERVIFFGTRLIRPFAFPKRTHGTEAGMKPHETVGTWIMDLADKGEEVPNHIALVHSERVIDRYRLIREGGKLPPPDRLPKNIRRRNFGNTYKRLDRKKPSLTLVPGNNAFPIHPVLDRSLTPREAARLQTFPDSFILEGNRREQCILVGNAVPMRLAQAIGCSVLEHFRGQTKKEGAAAPIHTVSSRSKSTIPRLRRVLPLNEIASWPDSQGFVDLFSGAGGFTIGFARAGWKPLLCVDVDRTVAETHRHNFPAVPFMQSDLSQEDARKFIADICGGKDIGIVVGGPPCQGFSIFGNRRFVNTRGYDTHKDRRNRLVYSFIDVIRKTKPRWFVMENVPGFASLDDGLFLEAIVTEFSEIGYTSVEAHVLNAADYGVPQLRRRLLVIGNRTGHIVPWPKKKFFKEPADWQKAYRTAGEVLSDLASESSYSKHTCHVPMKHKPLLVERYRYIPEGGKLNVDALPERLRRGYRTEKVQNYSHVFRRLHGAEPSITMVPGHNAFPIHPWLDRALTVREAARIQTFPDEIEFRGTRQEQCIQVGNAFPPLLAELIGNNIRKAEVNGWLPNRVPPSAYYALVERAPDLSAEIRLVGGTP